MGGKRLVAGGRVGRGRVRRRGQRLGVGDPSVGGGPGGGVGDDGGGRVPLPSLPLRLPVGLWPGGEWLSPLPDDQREAIPRRRWSSAARRLPRAAASAVLSRTPGTTSSAPDPLLSSSASLSSQDQCFRHPSFPSSNVFSRFHLIRCNPFLQRHLSSSTEAFGRFRIYFTRKMAKY